MAGIGHGFSNLNSDQVTMSGEAVQFPDYPASEIVVMALKGNLDVVYIGNQSVTEANGLELIPGASVTLHLGRTSMVWGIGAGGDKLSFAAAY